MADENSQPTGREHLCEMLCRLHSLTDDQSRWMVIGALIGQHAAIYDVTPAELCRMLVEKGGVPTDEEWADEMQANAQRKHRNNLRLWKSVDLVAHPRRNQG